MKIRNYVAALNTRVWSSSFLVIVTAIVSISGTVLLQETVKHLLGIYFSVSPRLSYEVISISRLTSYDLSEYAKKEFDDSFKFELDDPVIKGYSVFKLRLKNEGPAIEDGFKLEALVAEGKAKIIDVKHLVKSPTNKTVPVTHSLPSLTWRLTVQNPKVALVWQPPAGPVLGYYLYRSTFKDVGYGKFNAGIIRKTCFTLNNQNSVPDYYAVAAIGFDGTISSLSTPVKYPEILALGASFKDVVGIDPNLDPDPECRDKLTRTYRSIPEALRSEDRRSTFLINRRRSEMLGSLNSLGEYNRDLRIIYKDDLDFLRGKVELSFPSGFDEAGNVLFYVLAKVLPDTGLTFKLFLMGQPKIKLVQRDGNETVREMQSADPNKKKQLLTPKVINARTSKKSISLVWPDPIDKSYKGVKIFRRIIVKGQTSEPLQEPIYEGPALKGEIECRFNRKIDAKPEIQLTSPLSPAPNEPPLPKPKGIGSPPAAPGSLALIGPMEAPINYYIDDRVVGKSEYRYTIYTFDDQMNFSYPVEVNASLSDISSGLDCKAKESNAQEGASNSNRRY